MSRLGRISKSSPRQRFRILPFANESGSRSWRVQGMKRDRTYIRENYRDLKAAQCRQIELEAEFHRRAPDAPNIRATTLSESQTRLAEQAFGMLDADVDLLTAITWWRHHGSQKRVAESPRLDDALAQFNAWLAANAALRPTYKHALGYRTRMFVSVTGNLRVADVTAEHIERFLDGRKRVSAVTLVSDKRAISRFLAWCRERPRRWVGHNAALDVMVDAPAPPPPAVLSVAEVDQLLRAARAHGCLPYAAVTILAGVRPFEARRLTWEAVNLDDGEIRLDAATTKTGRPRVIEFNDGPPEQRPFNAALAAWLRAARGGSFAPTVDTWLAVRREAGITTWIPDAPRHTAISHYFRLTGSYGRAAALFGNSESIIKAHYAARVSSEDTRRFYALRP